MACFTAPLAEAIIATVASKALDKKEKKSTEKDNTIPFSRKLRWLSNLQFGGAALLMFEHIWHGEITAWFPFLTSMTNRADTISMLQEIATVGVAMSVLCTAIWGVMLLVSKMIEKRADKEIAEGSKA